MMIRIKVMETDEEKAQKAVVHWKTWQETYTDILPPEVMADYTLDKCRELAFQYPDNTLIVTVQDEVVGFSAFGQSGEADTGEIFALYLFQACQGKGIGYHLLTETLHHMRGFKACCLWVLEENVKAIAFYQKCGFTFDGESKDVQLGRAVIAQKMVLKI